ncbi:sulfite exporter TauE/SafE [Toxoplasma gondii TgCatPRC2]|uniref:Sulfite exporter TauE/SafE n=3 Tax=Toxoplasma gondii TaxID=5811 RepID=A0A151HAE0_TOXGO|nr:hypothetical protein TGME49_205300 [Toxoplasma gondii ME49]EPT29985.1 hypothetical protein TGME49_205300 [Toxoplasma gondii ME49]KYK66316.1 sulfite exporter TauE/SafE [Toxoplasma gondii TgCatPRC2]PIM02409.1 sulfite exporter TauE/SafE protein [Toxoplasma gondii COUG]|eukprot:XP_018637281.1 hypothetical protein TGME49_205300 [Toxoplasma gondii ME49]
MEKHCSACSAECVYTPTSPRGDGESPTRHRSRQSFFPFTLWCRRPWFFLELCPSQNHAQERRVSRGKMGSRRVRAFSSWASTAVTIAVLAAVSLISFLPSPHSEPACSESSPACPPYVAPSSFAPWLFADAVLDLPSAGHEDRPLFGLRGDPQEAPNTALLFAPRRLGATEDSEKQAKSVSDLANPLDVVGVLAIGIASIIAVAAGAGGGAIYVPIMILVMGFTVYEATATSQALMFGGSLAGTSLNLFRRHPYADRPAIDLDLVLLMGPMQIAGATFGLVINRCWPVYLIMALLVVLLFATAYKTFRQMMRLKHEGAAARKQLEQRSGSLCEALEEEEQEEERARRSRVAGDNVKSGSDPRGPCLSADAEPAATADNETLEGRGVEKPGAAKRDLELVTVTQSETENSDGDAERLKAKREINSHAANADPKSSEEEKGSGFADSSPGAVRLPFPQSLRYALRGHSPIKWFAMFVVYAINLAFTIIKGGPRTRWEIVSYCGSAYWGVYVLGAAFLMSCSYAAAMWLWRNNEKERGKIEVEGTTRAQPKKGELEYSFAHVHSLMGISLVAGMMAGIIGIGGGLILGPFLLVKGVPPAVTTSVNTTMILFTSSSAAAISVASGNAPWDYCLLLFGVCFLTTLIGKALVDKFVKRYHADYILVLLLLVIMLGSVVCTVVSGILTIKKGDPRDMSFKSPCY